MGSTQWKKLRLMVLDRDGRICYACGQEANEVDHIWPRAKGGDMFDPLNCAAICRACNLAKGDRFFSPTPTPPAFRFNNSPKGANQSKSVQNGHTTIHVDADSPFISPSQPGAN